VYLIKNKNKRKELGKKGLEKINKTFSNKIINTQIENILLKHLK